MSIVQPFILHRYVRKITSWEHQNLLWYLIDLNKFRRFNEQFWIQHLRFRAVLEVMKMQQQNKKNSFFFFKKNFLKVCGFCTRATCVCAHGTVDPALIYTNTTPGHRTIAQWSEGIATAHQHTSFVRLSICVPSHCLQGTLINICGLHERPNPLQTPWTPQSTPLTLTLYCLAALSCTPFTVPRQRLYVSSPYAWPHFLFFFQTAHQGRSRSRVTSPVWQIKRRRDMLQCP